MDSIQAMANRLFSMLAMSEQMVVLLDEFDEMGRARSREVNLLSRFITTAMLPKLAEINKRRKIVFLLATNYVGGFDAAFSRTGRFDMLIQVMPPNMEAKLSNWPSLKASVEKLVVGEQAAASALIGMLTYDETRTLVERVGSLNDPAAIAQEINSAWLSGTLNKPNEISWKQEDTSLPRLSDLPASRFPTWRATCEDDQKYIRLPG
jgi:SpoVK/Ycf46/Vps4 family AAA+-type ATPase